MSELNANESLVARIVDEFTDCCHRGESVDPEAYARRHPELASILRQVLPTIMALADRTNETNGWTHGDLRERFPEYEILGELGRGGMGAVYKARQRRLQRLAAIKVLRQDVPPSPELLERFRAESRAIAQLQHPNIVEIFEVGESAGLPYLVLEYCGGGSLAHDPSHLLRPPREAARLALIVARAIHVAHGAGLIHRDIKPGNILLTSSGEIKVSDFGLVKHVREDATRTQDGTLLGTPSYMAPEQATSGNRSISPAVDIYSLGAVLYDLLTGRPPFQAADVMATLDLARTQEPVPPQRLNVAVPRDLETICLKCLRKAPSERYSTAAELAEDLQAFLEHRPIRARRVTPIERAVKFVRRSPGLAATMAALLLTLALAAVGMLVVEHRADTRADQQRLSAEAAGLVTALVNAETSQVPGLLAELRARSEHVRPLLRERWTAGAQDGATAGAGSQRLNLALALVGDDPSCEESLWTHVRDATPAQLTVMADVLMLQARDPQGRCLSIIQDPDQPARQTFRAACLLARLAPNSPIWSEEEFARLVAAELVGVPPSDLGAWSDLLQPVFPRLVEPLKRLKDEPASSAQARLFAVDLLADHHARDPAALVELGLEAEPEQFAVVLAKLRGHRTVAAQVAAQAWQTPADEDLSEAELDRLAERRARAGALLVHLDAGQMSWSSFGGGTSPRLRAHLIHLFPRLDVPSDAVWDAVVRHDEVALRTGLLLCLGGYSREHLAPAARSAAIRVLRRWREEDPDAGVHSAVDWLLRQWGHAEPLPPGAASAAELDWQPSGRRWFVNSQGQTFSVLRAYSVRLGSPETEVERHDDERQYERRLDRTFAIATTEVTMGQFRRFRSELPLSEVDVERRLDEPVAGITWYDAVAYCNWLSEQEQIPRDQWCYEPNANGEYAEGMRASPGFVDLAGYRLPTEAEWEFACRGGTQTSRYCGGSGRLLSEYAWYSPVAGDVAHPVGLLRPNDFGLFDTLGNLYEWCHDLYDANPAPLPQGSVQGDSQPVVDLSRRVVRGGSYDHSARYARAAYRSNDLVLDRIRNNGFRLARTLKTPAGVSSEKSGPEVGGRKLD